MKPSIADVAIRCKEFLKDDTEDALWFQRLAETFQSSEEYKDGVGAFRKAIELGGSEKSCFQGLAHCLAADDQVRDACKLMEKVLVIMETENQPAHHEITDIHFKLAGWYGELKMVDQAIAHANKTLQSVSVDDDVSVQALKFYLNIGEKALATDLLCKLLGCGIDQMRPATTQSGLLKQILSTTGSGRFISQRSRDQLFVQCFGLLRDNTEALDRLLCLIDKTIDSGEAEVHNVALLLYKGIGLYFFSQDSIEGVTARHKAQSAWKECLVKSGQHGQTLDHEMAAMLLSTHHFEQAIGFDESVYHRQYHIEQMKGLAADDGQFGMSAPRAHLAAYYLAAEDQTEARNVLRASIKTVFDLLSDDIEDNDQQAYYNLACILTHFGDDINARRALSLQLPWNVDIMDKLLTFDDEATRNLSTVLMKDLRSKCHPWETLDIQIMMTRQILTKLETEHPPEDDSSDNHHQRYSKIREVLSQWSGNRGLWDGLCCDGCLRSWTFDLGMHQCKCCFDTCFCDDCLADMPKGQMQKLTVPGLRCKSTHDKLQVPKLDRAALLMAFRGEVRMGNDAVVPASEWVNSLKREWGYVDH